MTTVRAVKCRACGKTSVPLSEPEATGMAGKFPPADLDALFRPAMPVCYDCGWALLHAALMAYFNHRPRVVAPWVGSP